MNSPPSNILEHPERATATVGSIFRLLEKEKINPNHREDFEKIRNFINQNTGFRFSTGSSDERTMIIRGFAKGKNEIS